jgi:hypothetical protein
MGSTFDQIGPEFPRILRISESSSSSSIGRGNGFIDLRAMLRLGDE